MKPSLSTDKVATSDKTILFIEGTWEKDMPINAKVFNLLENIMYDGPLSKWAITGKGKRYYLDGTYDGITLLSDTLY